MGKQKTKKSKAQKAKDKKVRAHRATKSGAAGAGAAAVPVRAPAAATVAGPAISVDLMPSDKTSELLGAMKSLPSMPRGDVTEAEESLFDHFKHGKSGVLIERVLGKLTPSKPTLAVGAGGVNALDVFCQLSKRVPLENLAPVVIDFSYHVTGVWRMLQEAAEASDSEGKFKLNLKRAFIRRLETADRSEMFHMGNYLQACYAAGVNFIDHDFKKDSVREDFIYLNRLVQEFKAAGEPAVAKGEAGHFATLMARYGYPTLRYLLRNMVIIHHDFASEALREVMLTALPSDRETMQSILFVSNAPEMLRDHPATLGKNTANLAGFAGALNPALIIETIEGEAKQLYLVYASSEHSRADCTFAGALVARLKAPSTPVAVLFREMSARSASAAPSASPV